MSDFCFKSNNTQWSALESFMSRKNINTIGHRNTITERHLNGSKLHLNLEGNKYLTEMFTEVVLNLLQ